VARHPWTLLLAVIVAGNVAGWRAVEAERHNRCEATRADIQEAFVAVVIDLGADGAQARQVDETVTRVLPVDEC
jgi:hypothetical protein